MKSLIVFSIVFCSGLYVNKTIGPKCIKSAGLYNTVTATPILETQDSKTQTADPVYPMEKGKYGYGHETTLKYDYELSSDGIQSMIHGILILVTLL